MQSADDKKELVFQTEMLTDVLNGIYTVTNYYSDGTTEQRQVPKGPMIHNPSPFPIYKKVCPTCGK